MAMRTSGFSRLAGCCAGAVFCVAGAAALAEGTSGALLPPSASPVENHAPPAAPPTPKAEHTHAKSQPAPAVVRAPARRPPPPTISHAFPPPAGETRFRAQEVLVE